MCVLLLLYTLVLFKHNKKLFVFHSLDVSCESCISVNCDLPIKNDFNSK